MALKTTRTAPHKACTVSPAKHVHWGGVEAQPAYQQPQDDEDHAEEPEQSPPFSRLLLPPPPPAPAPQRDARPERATRIPARRAMPLALQKPIENSNRAFILRQMSVGDGTRPIQRGQQVADCVWVAWMGESAGEH